MIQGIGNGGASAESFRTGSSYQRKEVDYQNTKKTTKEDDAIFSKESTGTVDKKSDQEAVARNIRDEYRRFQASIVHNILKNAGINVSGKVKIDGEEINWDSIDWDKIMSESDKSLTTEQLIDMLPDEWKPDAVAERIVNFATSFYEKSGLDGKEFYDKIKAAIDSGFGSAAKITGKLPGNIQSVIDFTRNAVYDKLDKWAENMGIQIPYTGEDKDARLDVTA